MLCRTKYNYFFNEEEKKIKQAIKKWKNKEVEIKKWKKAKKDKKHVDKVKGSWYYIRAPSEKALGSIFEN